MNGPQCSVKSCNMELVSVELVDTRLLLRRCCVVLCPTELCRFIEARNCDTVHSRPTYILVGSVAENTWISDRLV
jgi:hypothetical protein